VTLIISRTEATLLIAQLIVMTIAGLSLWYKIFLPTTYYLMTSALAVILSLQMIKNHRISFFIFSLVLSIVFMRNVYYLATNYAIIPFGDGNWDYGVVKTFAGEGHAFVITEQNYPATLLTWYSGWPILHILALCLSQVSGINAYQVALLLPSIIGTCSLVFVYLLVDKIRKSLKLASEVTGFALLLYSVSPEALFWTVQFVRQNLGILFLVITFFLVYKSWIEPKELKYTALTIFFALTLVMVHHFTSFILVSYFLLFSVFLVLGTRFAKRKFGNKLFGEPPNVSKHAIFALGLISLVFLFTWWNNYGTTVWPTITSGIVRFVKILTSAQEIEHLPSPASYPEILTPTWVTAMSLLRDIFIYVPALLGLVILTKKVGKTPGKLFVVYSTLSLGLLFIIDYLVFRQEVYRVITLALPFVSLLGAVSYSYIKNKLKRIRYVPVISIIVVFFLFYSFIGLWGHGFAPLHLYDPSISYGQVGERKTDFIRLGNFNEKVITKNSSVLWADDLNPMLFLINSSNYDKIRRLPRLDTAGAQEVGSYGKEIIYELKGFNLYFYYAGGFSPYKNPRNASVVAGQFELQVQSKFSCVYNDGKYRLWMNP
jgi:hypothetical protein